MASKSTPLKRKIETDSDTPDKKRNWLSLEDELDKNRYLRQKCLTDVSIELFYLLQWK